MATTTLPDAEIAETKNEAKTESKSAVKKSAATKYVYSFGGGKADGNGKMKDVLGGKGAGLAEMTNAGLPVPPGFTIQTEGCREYMRSSASRKISTARCRKRWPRSKIFRARSLARATIRCSSVSDLARSFPCPA